MMYKMQEELFGGFSAAFLIFHIDSVYVWHVSFMSEQSSSYVLKKM